MVQKLYQKEKLLVYVIFRVTLYISCTIDLETIKTGGKQSYSKLSLLLEIVGEQHKLVQIKNYYRVLYPQTLLNQVPSSSPSVSKV